MQKSTLIFHCYQPQYSAGNFHFLAENVSLAGTDVQEEVGKKKLKIQNFLLIFESIFMSI